MSVGYTTSKDTLSRNTGLTNQGPTNGAFIDVPVWVRPSSWLDLPTVGENESKIVGLVEVGDSGSQWLGLVISAYNPSLPGFSNFTIDWGDGTVETFASGATVRNHVYDFATISSPLTDTGSKQVIVQIYPASTAGGDYLVSADISGKYTGTTPGTLTNFGTAGWLDVLVNCPNMTSLIVGYSNGGAYSYMNKCRQFSLRKVGNLSGNTFTLSGLVSLESVPEFNIQSAISFQNMFYYCTSLKVAPSIPWQYCTNAFQMFYNCSSLVYVPDATTPMNAAFTAPSSVTRLMFYKCYNLVRAPWLDTSKNVNTQQMFVNCTSLQVVPEYDYSNCANTTAMFDSCYTLSEPPVFNNLGNVAVLNTSSMFSNCYSLTSLPELDISGATNMGSMFNNCSSITSSPVYNTGNATTLSNFMSGCISLSSIPTFDTSKATNVSAMLPSSSLTIVPALNLSNATTIGTMFSSGQYQSNSITSFNCVGMNVAFSIQNMHLGKEQLESMFNNMAGNTATSRTVTITSNPGADTAVSKTATWTTSNKLVTITASGSVVAGMYMYNNNAVSEVNCGFTSSSDTIGLTSGPSFGPIDGTLISFTQVPVGSGLTTYTNYYVVESSVGGNSFKVATTPGGTAIDITNSGTGRLRYALKVESVVGTSVTLDNYPMAAGTAAAVTFRYLNTNIAQFKSWTVTG